VDQDVMKREITVRIETRSLIRNVVTVLAAVTALMAHEQ
jgi:hypothetical protein